MSPIYKTRKSKIWIAFFLAPTVLIFVAIVIIPLFQSFYYSFFEWNGISTVAFRGLENYKRLLKAREMAVPVDGLNIVAEILLQCLGGTLAHDPVGLLGGSLVKSLLSPGHGRDQEGLQALAACRNGAHKGHEPGGIYKIRVLTDTAPGEGGTTGIGDIIVAGGAGDAIEGDRLGDAELLYVFLHVLPAHQLGDLGEGAVAGVGQRPFQVQCAVSCFAGNGGILAVFIPSGAMRRSSIPVRSLIH